MRGARTALGCLLALGAACATPGQVRRVETQVAILDRDHARADSARAAELVRAEMLQRQSADSINVLVRQLNESVQRLARETAGNFDNLRQQLYQVANLANATQSRVARLGNQIETATAAPPPSTVPGDTTHPASGTTIPQPDALLADARRMMDMSAYGNARIALNQLLQSYPQASQVPDALYYLGYSFDPTEPDSARVYYNRVWKSYPDSPRAPTSLFKLGELEKRAANTSEARRYWQLIVDKYKSADEYPSAQDRLRENP